MGRYEAAGTLKNFSDKYEKVKNVPLEHFGIIRRENYVFILNHTWHLSRMECKMARSMSAVYFQ